MILSTLFVQVAAWIDVAPTALILFVSPVVLCPLMSWACDRRGARR